MSTVDGLVLIPVRRGGVPLRRARGERQPDTIDVSNSCPDLSGVPT